MTDEQTDEMTFYEASPDIGLLKLTYESTLADLSPFNSDCYNAYNYRRNIWPGKQNDLRKGGSNSTPWEGASDTEANVVAERINTYVSICGHALSRSNIQAMAVSADDVGRASSVSSFVKWMRDSYIPDFKGQMELATNFLFEKSLAVSYVGWQKELRRRLQRFTIEEIDQMAPGLGDMILAGESDDELADMLVGAFAAQGVEVMPKRARQALKHLRSKGEAAMPIAVVAIDRPVVRTLAPDGDVFWPVYVTDIQRSPVIFMREFLTPQELQKKVATDGWDQSWVDYVISNFRGQDTWRIDGEQGVAGDSGRGLFTTTAATDDSLVMVVTAYQRLIDSDDKAEGIYCTVFHPSYTGEGSGNEQGFAKFELLDGFDDYPFVVTPLSKEQKRLYEGQNFGMLLRGTQFCVKTERDQRIDRSSLAMGPPIMHPPGRPPSDWGPFRRVPERRPGEYRFGPIPPPDNGSKEVELTLIQQADRLVGLDYTLPNAAVRQQFYIDKVLTHAREVLKMARKLCRRFGPPELTFRISGDPNAVAYDNTQDDEDMDVSITFDSQNTDPETVEKKVGAFMQLRMADTVGVIDVSKLLYMAGAMIDPGIADFVFQPVEAAQEKIVKAVTDDLAKLYSGVAVGAQPNGAQIAMQVIQAWLQEADIAERMQSDEAFNKRVMTYIEQYQMQIMQATNAQTGKLGTAPATFQGTNQS